MNCLVKRSCQLVFCLSLIYSVNGLKCFECTLSDGDACSTSLNKTGNTIDCRNSVFALQNIGNEEFICMSITRENSTKMEHTRRCGLKSESNICEQLKGQNNSVTKLTECRVCQEDYCNSSITLKSSLLIPLLSITFLLFNK